MEVEVVTKKENELLDRVEVTFKVVHPKEGTPQREAVREKIASVLKATKERVVVDSMDSEFGKTETMGYAKVYKTKEAAMKYERGDVLVRNKVEDGKVTRTRKHCPKCGPGVFMAEHDNRTTCGKCCYTEFKKK